MKHASSVLIFNKDDDICPQSLQLINNQIICNAFIWSFTFQPLAEPQRPEASRQSRALHLLHYPGTPSSLPRPFLERPTFIPCVGIRNCIMFNMTMHGAPHQIRKAVWRNPNCQQFLWLHQTNEGFLFFPWLSHEHQRRWDAHVSIKSIKKPFQSRLG